MDQAALNEWWSIFLSFWLAFCSLPPSIFYSFPLLLIIFFVQSDPSFFLPGLDIFLCHFPINFFLCFLLSCGPFYGQYILLPLTPPAANNNNSNNDNNKTFPEGNWLQEKLYIHTFTIHTFYNSFY